MLGLFSIEPIDAPIATDRRGLFAPGTNLGDP